MSKDSKISTDDLDLAEDLRRLVRVFDSSIKQRMFQQFRQEENQDSAPPASSSPSTEWLLREIDVADEYTSNDPFVFDYLTRMDPLRRLLETEDQAWLDRTAPALTPIHKTLRLRLVWQYARTIEQDLSRLFLGKKIIFRIRNHWHILDLMRWRANGAFLVAQIRAMACLQYLGLATGNSAARDVVTRVSQFILEAVAEARTFRAALPS